MHPILHPYLAFLFAVAQPCFPDVSLKQGTAQGSLTLSLPGGDSSRQRVICQKEYIQPSFQSGFQELAQNFSYNLYSVKYKRK